MMNVLWLLLLLTAFARAADIDCLVFEVAVQSEAEVHEVELRCMTDADESYVLDAAELEARGIVVVGGRTMLSIEGASVDDSVISLAAATVTLVPNGAREVETIRYEGTSTVLVLRVIATDTQPTATAATLSQRWFDDPVCFKSQMEDCSFNKMNFVMAQGADIVNGVAEIEIGRTAIGQSRSSIESSVTWAATAVLGSLSQFDHVAYCLPPGTQSGWIAYGYFGSYRTVYNDNWCTYVSAQMHEIGHNMNLMHAGQGTSEYGDQSGMMGYSYSQNDAPKMCFNAAKSSDLGWYDDRRLELDPLTEGSSNLVKLVGLADYASTVEGEHVVILKIELAGTTDLYLTYNRAYGVNSGTKEFKNEVTVVQGGMPQMKSKSSNLAGLAAGESYSVANFDGAGSSLVVKFCELVSEPELDSAYVTVYLDDGTQSSLCPGDSPPAGSPTAGPTATPTSTPTTPAPSAAPSATPTLAPSTSTAGPTVGCTCDLTLTVQILTDNYPGETTWTLEMVEDPEEDLADDCNVAASAGKKGGYASAGGGPYALSGNTYTTEVPGLCRFRDYVFVIYDSYGDGLCCNYGVGDFELLLEGGFSIYKNGGVFGKEAAHTFTAVPPPTVSPTSRPTATPTATPTSGPTATPTAESGPTVSPTGAGPTATPTTTPTSGPTASPTLKPTAMPTSGPTATPTTSPTASPTLKPTATPTSGPTAMPTSGPTATPTSGPTASPTSPSVPPSATPTASPTANHAEGPHPVDLGGVSDFVIFGKTGITTTSGTVIEGNIGTALVAASLTGLLLVADGDFYTSSFVSGRAYAATSASSTELVASLAVDMDLAYADAAGRIADFTNAEIALGSVLTPGVYEFTGALGMAAAIYITLEGGPTDTFIIQVNGAFAMGAGAEVRLSGGIPAENVVWQVLGAVTIGAGANLVGVVLMTGAGFLGAGATVEGRMLSRSTVGLTANSKVTCSQD